MRHLSAEFAAALEAEATTFCHCWRLVRRDGAAMGFTDHDRDISFGGVIYKAASGLDAAQAEYSLGFSIGGGDVQGALIDSGLNDRDLDAGLYDDANVEIWLVDWTDAARRVLLDVATIGEVRRSEHAFSAELRSVAHRFDQERGRQFQRGCSADLGDARCGVLLEGPQHSTPCTILAVEGAGALRVQLAKAFEPGYFARGALALLDGAEPGPRFAIQSHDRVGADERIVLWSSPVAPIEAGAQARIYAGCDKSPEACAWKFGNIVNFRGFPHMPGNDVVVAYPKAGGVAMDGGSLFR